MSAHELTYEKPSDTAALRPFVERLARAYGKGLDPDEALSQAWWRMLRAVETYEPGHGKAFQSWAIWHVRSGLWLLRRSAQRRRRVLAFNTEWVEDFGAAGQAETLDPAIPEALAEAMTRLTPRQYQVVELVYIQGKSIQETADAMGIFRQAVQQLLAKALLRMRRTKAMARLRPELEAA